MIFLSFFSSYNLMKPFTNNCCDKTNRELIMFIVFIKSETLFFFHSSAVGVGFYGNSETNDGVYQLTYSLSNANHTLGGINNLVRGACQAFFNLQPSASKFPMCSLKIFVFISLTVKSFSSRFSVVTGQ